MPPIPATDDPSHPANLPLDDDQREMLMRVYHLTQSSQPANVTAATLPITQGEAHDFIKESYRRHFERVPALA
jgi:phospholipase C